MSYTSKTLLPDENVLYKGHVSALYFAPALLLALIGAVVLIFALAPETGALAYIHQDNDELAGFYIFLGFAILLWALIKFLKILFYKWTSEFIITDKRCILEDGPHKHLCIRHCTGQMRRHLLSPEHWRPHLRIWNTQRHHRRTDIGLPGN